MRVDEMTLWVELADGGTIGAPLAWFPRLLYASPEQRQECEISRGGPHWDAMIDDISIAGLLAVRGDMTQPTQKAA